MSNYLPPKDLSLDQIESVERLSARLVFQAMTDHAKVAWEEFQKSPDDADGIAEDITREAMGRFPGYPLQTRMYGRIDYRRAGYQILDRFVTRQALMVDSKAEKDASTATLQTNQTSLPLLHTRSGKTVMDQGELPNILNPGNEDFLTTTIFVHYHYEGSERPRTLRSITIASLPNGLLAAKYVVSAEDTIWRAGRNAPTLGEPLRVRLVFAKLQERCPWRVQVLPFDSNGPTWAKGLPTWNE